MDSFSRNIPNTAHKSVSCKSNSNLFPFGCHLVEFIRVAWIAASSVLTGKSHLFVTVTDRIAFANSKSKYYTHELAKGNPDLVTEASYRNRHKSSAEARKDYNMILLWDLNVKAGLLPSNEGQLERPFNLDPYQFEGWFWQVRTSDIGLLVCHPVSIGFWSVIYPIRSHCYRLHRKSIPCISLLCCLSCNCEFEKKATCSF